ncbi:MAG: hypothetical protein M1814_001378 [Vezdaea aestivalis]|nr:MAG: hypothetical protein M1814_001378 [Vezdaea aestivalis]
MPAKQKPHQASSVDAAIAALEASSHSDLTSKRTPCNCNGQRHPLLTAAPNCLSCGKIVCVKEGFGPCLFCKTPLLSEQETEAMLGELKAERRQELQEKHNAGQGKKVERGAKQIKGLDEAQAHRDRLLGYQASSAQRTRVHDEVADFETPDVGGSKWASPQERARQVKRQIQHMKDLDWDARDDWEKRQVVVSLDVSKGKITKRVEKMEKQRPAEPEISIVDTEIESREGPGAFSMNPLLGSLVRPIYEARDGERNKGKGAETLSGKDESKPATKWRRVQDDMEDNEAVILDGGVYGSSSGW